MLDKWNLSLTDINFFNLPTNEVPNIDHGDVTSYNDSSIGIYRSDTWFPSINNSALAITQYYARRRNLGTTQEYLELTHADIIVNYRYYNFTKDPNETGVYHLPSVILHELGHLLGLSHQNNYDLTAVMSPYMSIVENHDDIENNDIQRIKYKYNDSIESNPSSGSDLVLGASSDGSKKEEFVRGVIELRISGEHKHYLFSK